MFVFNYKKNDPEACTFKQIKENENYKNFIIENDEYDFILTENVPDFMFTNLYPVVDKILSTNEFGHKIGTLKLQEHILPDEEKKDRIRFNREQKCFPIINRGTLWYENLNEDQKNELKIWYQSWLDATESMIEPENLEWLK